jgi:hypothetical protein
MKTRTLLFPLSVAVTALMCALPAQAAQQSAAEVEDIGEISEAGPASGSKEIKETVPTERPGKFRFAVTPRAQWTSNAELSGNHGSGDLLFFPTLEAGFNTKLGRGFSFDLSAKLESAVFAEHDERSFIGYSAVATLDWRPRPNLPRLFISAEPYRYDRYDDGDLLTQAIGLTAGTDWGIALNNGRSLLFTSYSYGYYFSDPGSDTRGQHRLVLGLTHQLRPQLFLQGIYQYQYNHFENVDRHDSRHILGTSLIWQINRRLYTTLSGTFVDSDSSQNNASYQSAGAMLGLTWQF